MPIIERENERNQHRDTNANFNDITWSDYKLCFAKDKVINILIIEDNYFNRMVIERSLRMAKKKGLITFIPKFTNVTSLKQAKNYLKCIVPDLIILDLRLKDSAGEETFKEVSNATDAPIIVYSANHNRDMIFKLIEDGAKKYILKPVENCVATISDDVNEVLASEIFYTR